jgi:hypothetical protein
MVSRPSSLKRFGTALTRTLSSSSVSSAANEGVSSASSSSAYTTPGTTDNEHSPGCTPNISRSGSPIPVSKSTSAAVPLERQTSSSIASSIFSLLSGPSPRSDPFEEYLADKRKRERKAQKALEKRMKEFHEVITGAVFVGTVVHYLPVAESGEKGTDETAGQIKSSGPQDAQSNVGTSNTQRVRQAGRYKIGVTNIAIKDPVPAKSAKAMHYQTFVSYYNDVLHGEPLECHFDVFMRLTPREGARVSFIVTPTGQQDTYVAVACNIIDRHAPIHIEAPGERGLS